MVNKKIFGIDNKMREDMGMKTLTDEIVKERMAQTSDIRQRVRDKLSDDDTEQFNKIKKETVDLLYKCVEIAYESGFCDGVSTDVTYGGCEKKDNECVNMERESHTISVEDMTHLLSNPYVLVGAVVFILLLLLSLKQLNKYNISDTNTITTEL